MRRVLLPDAGGFEMVNLFEAAVSRNPESADHTFYLVNLVPMDVRLHKLWTGCYKFVGQSPDGSPKAFYLLRSDDASEDIFLYEAHPDAAVNPQHPITASRAQLWILQLLMSRKLKAQVADAKPGVSQLKSVVSIDDIREQMRRVGNLSTETATIRRQISNLRETLNNSRRPYRIILPEANQTTFSFLPAVIPLTELPTTAAPARTDSPEHPRPTAPAASSVNEVVEDFRAPLIEYLSALIQEHSIERLPPYFPDHLKREGGFDSIRQRVQVVTDKRGHDALMADKRERMRSMDGFDLLHLPPRSPEVDEYYDSRGTLGVAPETLAWEETRESNKRERFNHTIVLGDPGFGKTWLLRDEAIRLAQRARNNLFEGKKNTKLEEVPILLRLSDIDTLLADPPNLVAAIGECLPRNVRQAVSALLATEQIVVLLDGWDEVRADEPFSKGDKDPRHRLEKAIQAFAKDYKGRVIITSRSARYVTKLLPKATEVEILPFGPDEVGAFVACRFRHDYERRKTFQDQLREHRQITGLARIPLLLSLMCWIFDEPVKRLPTSCGELYGNALRKLLFDWPETDKERYVEPLRRSQLIARLAEAAWSFRLRGQFDDESFANGMGDKDVDEMIEVRNQALRCGVLVRVGRNQLMFLHRSFQEYLTARALSTRADWLQLVDDFSLSPAWHEVIVLLSAHRDTTPAIEKLLTERKDCVTSMLRPRLALAGRLAAEAVLDDARHGDLRRNIFRQLWQVWHKRTAYHLRACFEHIRQALICMLRSDPSLVTLLGDAYLASSLGPAAAAPTIVNKLIRASRSKKTDDRLAAIQAFNRLGVENPKIRTSILRMLSQDPDRHVRQHCVIALRKLAVTDDTAVVEAIIAALYDPSADVRQSAVTTLSIFGLHAKDVGRAAFLRMYEDEDSEVREAVIGALDSSEIASFEDALRILGKAMVEEDNEVRVVATKTIQRYCSNPTARTRLFSALLDSDAQVRSLAAEGVGEMHSIIFDEVFSALKDALENESSARVRVSILKALSNCAPIGGKQVMSIVIDALSDRDTEVKSQAIQCLTRFEPPITSKAASVLAKHFGRETPSLRADILLNLCLIDANAAARCFGQLVSELCTARTTAIRRKSALTLTALQWAYDSDAIGVLSAALHNQKSLRPRLTRLLVRKESKATKVGAVIALGCLGNDGGIETVDILLKLLSGPCSDLAWAAALALGQIGRIDSRKVIYTLCNYLKDRRSNHDEDVRHVVNLSLWRLAHYADEAAVQAMIELMQVWDVNAASLLAQVTSAGLVASR